MSSLNMKEGVALRTVCWRDNCNGQKAEVSFNQIVLASAGKRCGGFPPAAMIRGQLSKYTHGTQKL